MNGEYITACNHDDAVNILRNAGDIVVLTVKHYRAAKPFLQKNGDTIMLTHRENMTRCRNGNFASRLISSLRSTEKEEKLDNVANTEDGWISPNRQGGSPRCSHSRQSSNSSSTSMQYKRWVDVITGSTMCPDNKLEYLETVRVSQQEPTDAATPPRPPC